MIASWSCFSDIKAIMLAEFIVIAPIVFALGAIGGRRQEKERRFKDEHERNL